MALPEVLAVFDDHIARLPAEFIDLESLRLVNTHTFREAHLAVIASIGEEDIVRHTSYANQPREDVIRAIVKGVVKYAVLSHSFIPGEVLHHDMTRARQTSPGWDKLAQFCKIARDAFKCRFAWADPACIDKKNVSVLQKALISRFDYFRNAYVCIAYLSGTSELSNMNHDPWFYRGFTLTELLAPIRMKFYGAEWKNLNNDHTENDKADEGFLELLSAASGIPVADLRIFWPGPDRIRDKVIWASRQTGAIRIEDVSYSLIAIFDSRMPPRYGEGENAFTRLLMDIIPGSGECDAFAWAGPCSHRFPWLPRSPRGFGEQHCDQQLDSTPHHYRLCGDRSLSIDHDHLRIRVILLQVVLQPKDETTYQPILRHSASIGEVTLLDPKNLPRKTSQLAIGVIDYGWTDNQDEGVLRKGDRYFDFLLWYSSDKKWRKLQTEKTVLITNDEELVQKLTLLDIRV